MICVAFVRTLLNHGNGALSVSVVTGGAETPCAVRALVFLIGYIKFANVLITSIGGFCIV